MADPVTIPLSSPIEFGSQRIEEIIIRPLKAKDLRTMKTSHDDQIRYMLEMAGKLSGQSSQIIDELEGEDLGKVIEVVTVFLGAIQGAGENS